MAGFDTMLRPHALFVRVSVYAWTFPHCSSPPDHSCYTEKAE